MQTNQIPPWLARNKQTTTFSRLGGSPVSSSPHTSPHIYSNKYSALDDTNDDPEEELSDNEFPDENRDKLAIEEDSEV